jgi:hypothetical protein
MNYTSFILLKTIMATCRIILAIWRCGVVEDVVEAEGEAVGVVETYKLHQPPK